MHFIVSIFETNYLFIDIYLWLLLFSYLKLYTTLPIAKLAGFMDMVCLP